MSYQSEYALPANRSNVLSKFAAHAEADKYKARCPRSIGNRQHILGEFIQRITLCGFVRIAVPAIAWHDELQALQI